MYGKIESNRSLKFGSVLVILAIIASAMAVLFVLNAETSVSSAEMKEIDGSMDNRLQGNAGETTVSSAEAEETDESQDYQPLINHFDEGRGNSWEIRINNLDDKERHTL